LSSCVVMVGAASQAEGRGFETRRPLPKRPADGPVLGISARAWAEVSPRKVPNGPVRGRGHRRAGIGLLEWRDAREACVRSEGGKRPLLPQGTYQGRV
jgi:hypothetical protein